MENTITRTWLKDLREAKGFTQAELALNLSLAQSTVAMWETGGAQTDCRGCKASGCEARF